MPNASEPFILTFQDSRIRVQRHTIQGAFVYHITFENKRPPLVITRAEKPTGQNWWTSIPEGRQLEANLIGPLIEEHIKKTG
ncbi:MAG: hypothetical protein JNM88_14080 [Chitinophagaceae bacterium]|nr:hypothetical protein [Chitinophagaceae bacterium]